MGERIDPDQEARILWLSNSPHVKSGYGAKTTGRITEYLHKQGVDVMILGQQTLGSPEVLEDGRVVLPADHNADSFGVIEALQRFDRNILVLHYDAFGLPMEFFQGLKAINVDFVFYGPVVDHEPLSEYLMARYNQDVCDLLISQSEHGKEEMSRWKQMPECRVIPAPVNRDVFKPMDFPHDDGKFRVTCLKANKGNRSNIPSGMKAYKWFVKETGLTPEETEFYIHTAPNPEIGFNLDTFRQKLGLEDYVRFPTEVCRECDGDIVEYGADVRRCEDCDGHPIGLDASDRTLAELVYNRGDVFFNPAIREGFGLNMAESLACGVPVMGTPWAGGTERINPELRLEIAHLWTTPLLSDSALFDEEDAKNKLVRLYEDPDWRQDLAKEAYEMGKAYDEGEVLPLWDDVVRDLADRQYHKRQLVWGGLWTGDGYAPAHRPGAGEGPPPVDLEDIEPIGVPRPLQIAGGPGADIV